MESGNWLLLVPQQENISFLFSSLGFQAPRFGHLGVEFPRAGCFWCLLLVMAVFLIVVQSLLHQRYKRVLKGAWKNGSGVNGTCCSFRGFEFGSQCSYDQPGK